MEKTTLSVYNKNIKHIRESANTMRCDMNYRLWEILDHLTESEYKKAEYLGEKIGASEKTIRTRIKELNESITPYGAKVIARPRYGYCLKITDNQIWDEFVKSRYQKKDVIPADSKERTDYLLAVFLNRTEYVKLEELSEFLFISAKTLSNELKKVEYILEQFEIVLVKKPHYGIRASGKEFDKRRCILQNFYKISGSFLGMNEEQEKLTKTIAEKLLFHIREYQVKFSEMAFQDTVLYLYVSITRMRKGIYIQEQKLDEEMKEQKEFLLVRSLYQELLKKENFIAAEVEIYYAGIFISGKQFIDGAPEYSSNFVISEKTDKLVTEILEEIYAAYNIELRDDLNLRFRLIQHLMPMEIRLKYGILIEQSIAEEVKKKYFLSYTMAQQAAGILAKAFEKEISEEETACLALYFSLSLEEKKIQEKRKKNILLVCVSGKASSQLLMYHFKNEFEEYIQSLHVCGMYEFENYDLKDVDFIFTTVPIYKKVSVPIMEIHDFLESGEIIMIRNVLRVGNFSFLEKFYAPKHFYTDIEGTTREEVLLEICRKIGEQTKLPEGFYEAVMERETIGATDFGNMAAIPHPCRIMTEETIVAVAILKSPINWSTHMVQVVILTSLSAKKDEDTQKFYEVTTKFLSDKVAVTSLVENPRYEHLNTLLRNYGSGK